MTKPFFITGLPRTRTAWMSQFFTTNESYCYHEALRKAVTTSKVADTMLCREEYYVGNSDSSLPFYIDDMMEYFPDAPILIIERDVFEVDQSLRNLFGGNHDEILLKTMRQLDRIKDEYYTVSVNFEELDDPAVVEDVWKYLIPAIPFDKGHFERFNELNISINKKKYMSSITEETVETVNELLNRVNLLK